MGGHSIVVYPCAVGAIFTFGKEAGFVANPPGLSRVRNERGPRVGGVSFYDTYVRPEPVAETHTARMTIPR